MLDNSNPQPVNVQPSIEVIDPVLTLPIEIPVKSFSSPLERDKYIIERYKAGLLLLAIAKEVGLSEVRISQIVKSNKHSTFIDREAEKVRRFREIRKLEHRAKVLEIAPQDTKELLAVYESQRKELEGDSSGTVNNTQINITIDKIQIANLNDGDKLSKLRELLGS